MAFRKAQVQDDEEEGNEPEGKPTAKGKAKKEKKPKPPLVGTKVGHNSGLIPAAVAHVDAILAIDLKIKELGKAKRDHRNALKGEFGILSATQNYEISMRKKDKDVRIQIESNIQDFKTMLGYQPSLDLKEGTVARTEEEFADPGNRIPVDRIAREG